MVAPTPPFGQFYADISESTILVSGNPVTLETLLTSGEFAQPVGPATSPMDAPQWGQVFAGNNAAWNNVTSSRALGTTYTNSTVKPISVILWGSNSSAGYNIIGHVNGRQLVAATETVAAYNVFLEFTVPPGSQYSINWTGGTAGTFEWSELY